MVTDIGPSTVETIAEAASTRYPFQRKGFYARGYHFEFYYASNKIYWRRSADGITWESATDITPSGETPTEGAEIAVWLDRHEEPAHHPYVIYADHDTDSPIYFRRGTLDDSGNLTWDAVWQTAVALAVGVSYRNLTICVDDTNGYPFIGYTQTIRADPSSDSRPRVTHSQQMDGTWSTFAGFPDIMNATNDESWVCVVVPYNGVYVMAVYVRDSNEFKYDIYNVTEDSWAGEAGAGVVIGADANKFSVTSQRAGKVTAQDPRQIHIAFCFTDDNLNHISIDDGGVTGPTLIYNSAIAMGPSISTRIYGGDVNNYRTLYVFWTPITDAPTADYICYKKSVDAGANWTKEDGSVGVELWIDETGAGLSGVNTASSYFEEQHHTTLPESYIGILYTNKGASPDYVRWAGLEFADPDEDLLCNATIRQGGTPVELLGKAEIRNIGSADLLGKFVTQTKVELLGRVEIKQPSSADLLGKFVTQTKVELLGRVEIKQPSSAELLGKADIRQPDSAELLGKFAAQDIEDLLGNAEIRNIRSENLYAKFDVGQDSQDLLGRADVGQDSQDLLGKFESQATRDLLAKFEAQATAELLGEVIIRNIGSAELLGKAVIRNIGSVELLGKAVIRHVGTPVELLGRALIRHSGSAEFPGEVIIRNIGSAELPGEVIIRNIGSVELLGKFRTSTDHWIVQGVSVEAYIALTIVV